MGDRKLGRGGRSIYSSQQREGRLKKVTTERMTGKCSDTKSDKGGAPYTRTFYLTEDLLGKNIKKRKETRG